jgi:hypothetical protein
MSIEVSQMGAVGRLEVASKRIRQKDAALERAHTVLSNMALEHKTGWRSIFARWPISHEPLRADARNVLPIIEAAIENTDAP